MSKYNFAICVEQEMVKIALILPNSIQYTCSVLPLLLWQNVNVNVCLWGNTEMNINKRRIPVLLTFDILLFLYSHNSRIHGKNKQNSDYEIISYIRKEYLFTIRIFLNSPFLPVYDLNLDMWFSIINLSSSLLLQIFLPLSGSHPSTPTSSVKLFQK